MDHKIKHHHVKNQWLINSALRPFGMDIFSCYDTKDEIQNALHSIVKAIEGHHAVIIPRGIGVIEKYEKCYGPEKHDPWGKVNRIHPLWQYVYSN